MKICRVTDCNNSVHCKEICRKHYMQVFRQKPGQLEKRQKYNRNHYLINIDWYRARNKKSNSNREKMNAFLQSHREICPEQYRARSRALYPKHRFKNIARANKRRSAKMQRTPAWANLTTIKEFYKNCPDGMVVDHIVPLQGESVSGFHVEYNLQYLTPKENLKKGNKFKEEINAA